MVESKSQRDDPRPIRTRRAILAAADELLATRGVEGTTIAQVAAAAGVSVGSIYAHFGSKDALILALGGKAIEPRLTQLSTLPDTASAVERIVAVGDAYLRFAIDEPSTFSALLIRAHEPQPVDPAASAAATELTDDLSALLSGLEDDLETAMDDGAIRRAPVREALVGLLATWNGIADLATRRDGLGISADLAWSALALSQTLLSDPLPAARPFAPAPETQSA